MAYNLNDFQTDVIEACQTTPVVIDFWAEWCGPCKVLGPIIEKLAQSAKEKWKLVKINTEEHPELAAQFGVQSIPSVKMVYEGKLIAEFSGALPEPAIVEWLKKHLPESEEEEQDDQALESLLASGQRERARVLLAERLRENSDDKVLRAQFAMLLLPEHLAEAEQNFEPLKNDPQFEIEAETLDTIHFLLTSDLDTLPEGKTPKSQENVKLAIQELRKSNFETALEGFLHVLSTERSYLDDLARKACVAIFTILSQQHPVTQNYRRRFSMALY